MAAVLVVGPMSVRRLPLAPALALALALALLSPVGGAQSPAVPMEASLTIVPPTAGVEPERGEVEIPLALSARCDASMAAQPMTVAWSVARMPAWANVLVDPPTDSAGIDRCEGGPTGRVTFLGRAIVRASSHAPAFYAEALEVEALVTPAVGSGVSVSGTVPIFATYFSIIDVQAPLMQLPGGGGLGAAFPLKLTNLGNANTKVTFTSATSDPVAIDLPEPVVLQSKQAGGVATSADVVVVAHPSRPVEEPLHFRLRWAASYALDAQLVGDSGEITLIVLPGTGTASLLAAGTMEDPDARQDVPGLGAIGAALALVGAALVMRARRRD